MERITKDTFIIDVLMMDKQTAPIFVNYGMQCLGCPASSGESIEEACAVHGIDADQLISDLNNYFNTKNT